MTHEYITQDGEVVDIEYPISVANLPADIQVRFHPVANILPMQSQSQIDDLADNIKTYGLLDPIWLHRNGSIIDGRSRFLACLKSGVTPTFRTFDGDESSLEHFVIKLQIDRRNLKESQRALLAAEMATQTAGGERGNQYTGAIAQICAMPTQDAAADLFRVSRRLVQQARQVLASGVHDLISGVRNGTKTLNAALAQIKDDTRKATLYEEKDLGGANRLYLGDFQELSPQVIATESIELVFTDPPYDRASIPLYEAAAKEAARILKPGGSFMAYCGNVIIPDVIPLMRQHLRYFWTCACFHKDDDTLMQKQAVYNTWKPIFWFVKKHRGDAQTFVDDSIAKVVTGTGRDDNKDTKDRHEWGQPIEEAKYYIEHLTSENGSVVDFFAGGGTTPIAAELLGRNWYAFEINEKHADTANAAIRQVRGGA